MLSISRPGCCSPNGARCGLTGRSGALSGHLAYMGFTSATVPLFLGKPASRFGRPLSLQASLEPRRDDFEKTEPNKTGGSKSLRIVLVAFQNMWFHGFPLSPENIAHGLETGIYLPNLSFPYSKKKSLDERTFLMYASEPQLFSYSDLSTITPWLTPETCHEYARAGLFAPRFPVNHAEPDTTHMNIYDLMALTAVQQVLRCGVLCDLFRFLYHRFTNGSNLRRLASNNYI